MERGHRGQLGDDVQEILNVQKEEVKRGGPVARMAATPGRILASPGFFVTFILGHFLWIIANLPFVPWTPWDPYPFTFLATIASVEAPFIALLVLMYQRRMQRIADVREEVSLQFVLYAEQKTTMALRMLDAVANRVGVDERPEDLDRLMQDLDPQLVLTDIEEDIEETGGD